MTPVSSAGLPSALTQVVRFNAQGLVPAIVQDARTGQVLMLAYMNAEALAATLRTGEAHFWSRSRRSLWHKGATSGNIQRVVDLRVDCDGDTLLLLVEPAGPACHTGAASCFFRAWEPDQQTWHPLTFAPREETRA